MSSSLSRSLMAEEEHSEVKHASPEPGSHSLPFVEVRCTSSGEIRRFANGTDARFALSLINRKVGKRLLPLASHIEAAKEKEEPVSFGPGAMLVDYGDGWKLQTVTELEGTFMPEHVKARVPSAEGLLHHPEEGMMIHTNITMSYIGKILLAFVIMFVIGAAFTLALENLPRLLLFINSSMQ